MLVLPTATCTHLYPISGFSSVSVFVKALFTAKEGLDGIGLESQEHTYSISPQRPPDRKHTRGNRKSERKCHFLISQM